MAIAIRRRIGLHHRTRDRQAPPGAKGHAEILDDQFDRKRRREVTRQHRRRSAFQRRADGGGFHPTAPFPHHRQYTATSYDTGAWAVYPSRSFLPAKTRAMIDFLSSALPRAPAFV